MSSRARSILALNLGSASLKAASFEWLPGDGARDIRPYETGRVSSESGRHAPGTGAEDTESLLASVVRELATPGLQPDVVAHRIVHGADRAGPVELTPETIVQLQTLSVWAPLHQPAALALVQAAIRRWPAAQQIGVFDTSWHQTMPEKHRIFPIPYAHYLRGVKRYGFHGLAFQSAIRQLSRVAPELAAGRLVLAHLGGGSSLCAVLDGRSVNTTMGLTPLAGVAMGSRSGSLDPGVLLHLQRGLGMAPDEIDQLLWSQSGLMGLSDESGDMRILLASKSNGARRAIEVYVSEIVQGIASMAACLGGIDGLVFSGGIGAHAAEIRAQVCGGLRWLGLELDDERNQTDAFELSSRRAAARTFAVGIDEQEELARAVSIDFC